MSGTIEDIAGTPVWFAPPDGPPIGSERDATDLIGDALGSGARMIAIPVERLDPGFLDLSTRMAGLFVQKLLNYNWRVVFVGDITARLDRSKALSDWVREANRGKTPWFVEDRETLAAKLGNASGIETTST